jgi:hypothetical protein
MTMKKIMLMACMALGAISFMSSCSKVLDEKVFSEFSDENFPRTEADLRVLCNGMYTMMDHNDMYGFTWHQMTDLQADQFYTSPTGTTARAEFERVVTSPGNAELLKWWQRSYITIARTNEVLKVAPQVPSTALQRSYVAEAKFLRALSYFQLTKFFGNVPLITSAPRTLDSLKEFKPMRAQQKDIYELIIKDLTEAVPNLLDENKIIQKGVPSNGAAKALLAKVYLTRAYLPIAENTDFANAAALCQQVIMSGAYSLVPNFADVFDVTKENGPEHIFSVQFDQAPNLTSTLVAFLSPSGVYNRGFGSLQAERPFYNTFVAGDVRRAASYFDVGVSIFPAGKPYNYVATSAARPYCGKFKDPLMEIVANDRVNCIILRYADVLLMQSEALNRINPADPARFAGIDAVRARAGLSTKPLSRTLSQLDFETAIMNERGWEFAFEGLRRDDLIRLGRFVQVMTADGKTGLSDFVKYYPIPQTEIDLNSNLLPQNTGY